MSELISIIVPIFNVEKYLDNCVSSIVNQTYHNIEIILVDDGSPDRCGEMCDAYAEMDARIYVIHKKNGGLSDARNVGIQFAKGRYITFIDSDDYISYDFIEYLYRLLKDNNADISACGFVKTSLLNAENHKSTGAVHVFNKNDALAEMLYARVFTTSAWGKLYKKELFNGIEYPVGKYSEDMFTTYKLITKADVIACGNKICYFYVYRCDSILNSSFSVKHLDVLEAVRLIKAEGYINTVKSQKAYESQMVSSMAELLEKQPPDNEIVNNYWNEAKQYLIRVVFDKYASIRVRAYALMMMFGKGFATEQLVKYYSMKWKTNDDKD